MTKARNTRQSDKKKPGKEKPQVSFLESISVTPYAYLVFAALILFLYWPVFSFIPGKLDENNIIFANLEFLKNFANLKQVVLRDAFMSEQGATFYRPLQNISFMIDAHLSGSDGWGYYLMNMFIHFITCSLLYYLLRLFVDHPRNAFLVTLLFAVNPLFVQAIAWAPSRGDLLIGMFGLLAMISLFRYMQSGKISFLAIHLLSFALAMFSKETAVLFPVAFLFFYFFSGKERTTGIRGLIVPVLGYFVVIGFYLYLRGMVVKIGSSPEQFGVIPLLHNLRSGFEYLGKFFLPVSLSPMPGYTTLNTVIGVVVSAGLGFLIYRNRKGNPLLLLAGVGWYLLFLIPGMISSNEYGSAAYDYLEHRAYLPLFGIILVLFLIFSSSQNQRYNKNIPGIILVVVLIFGVYTRVYLRNYKDPVAFYELATKTNPLSAVAFYNRGSLKYTNQDNEGAIADYERALKIKSDYAEAYVNRGICRFAINDTIGAMEDFDLGIKYKNSLFQAHYNKANALTILGLYPESLKEYDIAVKLAPSNAEAYLSRGGTFYMIKNFEGALADFSKTLELDKNNATAYYARGKTYFMTRRNKEACRDWKKAKELGIQEAEAYLQAFCK
jgi:tetratricopeptide (TPR) repeat protein